MVSVCIIAQCHFCIMDWCDCDWNDSSWALPTNWRVPTDYDIKKNLVEVFMWYDVQIQLQIREIWDHLESVPTATGPAFGPDCYKPDIRAANNDPSDLCTPKRKAITAMLLERIESVIEQLKDVGFPGTAADIHTLLRCWINLPHYVTRPRRTAPHVHDKPSRLCCLSDKHASATRYRRIRSINSFTTSWR